MAKLTEAEKEAIYDAERSGSAYVKPETTSSPWEGIIDLITSDPWEPILAITDDPTNDGQRHDDDDDDSEEDEEDDEEAAAESVPVPPVPAGCPLDKALIYKSYGEVFIAIDRRDGEMVICNKEDTKGTILPPAYAHALYRFFWNDATIELMEYHRKKAT